MRDELAETILPGVTGWCSRDAHAQVALDIAGIFLAHKESAGVGERLIICDCAPPATSQLII